MLKRQNSAHRKEPKISFVPDFIASSVHTIDFKALKQRGIKACFIDLDNTVVEHGAYDVNPAIKNALKHSGLTIFIATNRPKSRDLKDIKNSLGAAGVIHPHGLVGKPLKRYFINGLKDVGLKSHETVMIGDRYLQDIYGSNRAGMYSLLVHKLGTSKGIIDRIISAAERRATMYLSKKYF